MRNYFLGTLVLTLTFLALTGLIGDSSSTSAQMPRGTRDAGTSKDDFSLASAIRGRTNRTYEGLEERVSDQGGTYVDLAGRFQNVMLAQLDKHNEPAAACVSDLNEANLFFRRNLTTGRAVASYNFLEAESEADAKRHGMTADEYSFYTQMASDFASGHLTAPAGSVFNIVNNDGANEGFNDQQAAFAVGEGGNNGTTRGSQRLNVFNAAAAVWAGLLDSPVPTNVRAEFNSIPGCSSGGGVLGSAGTVNVHRNFSGSEFPSTWYHAALANKRAGTDLAPGSPEIQAQFNTDVDSSCLGGSSRFYYGLDNATPSGRINLFVVVLHEIGHGLGFQSFVNGSSGTMFGSPAGPDIYLRYMYDGTLGMRWDQMTDAQRQTSARNTNAVFWDGPSVRSASGYLTSGRDPATGRVALYTPSAFSGGSSISHFSNSVFPNLIMEPSISGGLPLSLDLTRQLMRDIGWYRDTTNDGIPDAVNSVFPSGDSVIAGEDQAITWVNTGGFGRNVTIELSTDGGNTFTTIAADVSNTGSYNWRVPALPTGQARIRVREAGYAMPSGVSTANFTILAQPTSSPASASGRVTNFAGRVLSGVVVKFRSESGQQYSARTNTLGRFNLTGLQAGRSYEVTVTGKGVRFTPQEIHLSGNLAGLELRGH